jgi:molecular chaperone DnaK
MPDKIVVGIDLGTTFSAIAYVNPKYQKAEIIPPYEGYGSTTPSAVQFEDGGEVVVGTTALNNAIAKPDQVVTFVKREMGKDWTKTIHGKTYKPEELSAYILRKMKTDAEQTLEHEITDAVITVPAYFKDPERVATREAAKAAGLNVLKLVNEPTAAALAYSLQKGGDQTLFVFDLGGGTFDVTVSRVEGGKIRMLNTDGDMELGGKDWDEVLTSYLCQEFINAHGKDPSNDLVALADLRERAVKAKFALSQSKKASVSINFDGASLAVDITREKFEELCQPLVDRCESLSNAVLEKANPQLSWAQIDVVLLVGGSTRMPMIQKMVEQISGKTPRKDINPDEAVALGAAWAALLESFDAEGGSKPRGLLTGVEVVDGNSHSLGLIVEMPQPDGRRRSIVDHLIPKMSPLPFEITKLYSTARDNQDIVVLRVVETEETLAEDAGEPLGELILKGIPKMPQGLPQIEVTFSYDKSGVLNVKALEKSSGTFVQAPITRRNGLQEAESTNLALRVQSAVVTG